MSPAQEMGQPYSVVVPTVGRPSLAALLESLGAQDGRLPQEVIVVDDRPVADPPITVGPPVRDRCAVRVVRGMGRGPAAARNLGWRLAGTEWVAFLDDDVHLPPGWARGLQADLTAAGPQVAATQARIQVPLPGHRRPTDWERSTAGLQHSAWVTADMAYRRAALLQVGGFDERFPRAYREDADLALRVRQAGWELLRGRRTTVHPVRPAPDGISVRTQRGNADDALMRVLHGPHWRRLAGTGRGRLRWHVATVVAGAAALAALAVPVLRAADPAGHQDVRVKAPGRPLRGGIVGGGCWLALTADFARRRITPGPRDPAEVWRMLWTSAAIPPAAVWHRLRGTWAHRGALPWPPPVQAVLFDRDGTLVHDVPYNGDPSRVRPVEGAKAALDRLRAHGVKVGVVSNQSGIARGVLSAEQVDAVNTVIEERLGPFDTWHLCPHGPDDGCSCRKPAPGMVQAAAQALGVPAGRCAVVGDIEADLLAARAAGARDILVANTATRTQEVADAPVVATDLNAAVDLLLEARHD